MELNSLGEKKVLARLRKKNNICINMLCYENKPTFLIYLSDQKFENSMDLLFVIDENKSHYVYIEDLTDLCFTKQGIKTKNIFAKVVYSVLVVKMC